MGGTVKLRYGGLTTACVLYATLAAGQDGPAVSLSAPDPARWDAAAYAGWTGSDRTAAGATFDQWSDAASFGASAGYYWTPHAKLELQYAGTTWGEVFVQQSIEGGLFRFGQQRLRSDHLMATLHYQFFENTWFHPFAAAGVAGTRESIRLELTEQRICPPLPCIAVPLPRESSVSHYARPFVGTGFKWYFSERGFIRSDIRVLFATAGRGGVQWHTGIGFDF